MDYVSIGGCTLNLTSESALPSRATSPSLVIRRYSPQYPIDIDTPKSLFTPATITPAYPLRFIGGDNHNEVLLYTDGACSNNGKQHPTPGKLSLALVPFNLFPSLSTLYR